MIEANGGFCDEVEINAFLLLRWLLKVGGVQLITDMI